MPALISEGCTVYSRPAVPTFTTKSVNLDRWTEHDPLSDLMSRCHAAARMTLRGADYSTEDRLELASKLLSKATTAEYAAPLCGCGGPADYRVKLTGPMAGMTQPLGLCVRHSRRVPMARRTRPQDFPVVAPSFTRLTYWAQNERRALDAQRRRDDEHAAVEAAQEAFLPNVSDEWDGGRQTLRTVAECHRLALRMLGDIGLRPLRKGDANAYAAAYAAARSGTLLALDVDAPGEVTAEELSITYANLRAAISRAPKRIPSADARSKRAHRNALFLPTDDAGVSLKPSRSRTMSADLESKAWDADPQKGNRPITETRTQPTAATAPDWTTDLQHATRLRLNATAQRRRNTAATKSAAQREIDRLSAGLAPAVPELTEERNG